MRRTAGNKLITPEALHCAKLGHVLFRLILVTHR